MRAIVLFYNGQEIDVATKAKIAKAVAGYTGASIGDMIMKTLDDNDITKSVVNMCTATIEEQKSVATPMPVVIDKAFNILSSELTAIPTTEKEVLIRLLVAMRTREDKEAVENAIRVLGLYDNPAQLMVTYGLTKSAINAMSTLCKTVL